LYYGAPPGWPADFGKSPLAESVMLFSMWSPSLNSISPASKHFYDAYVSEYKSPPTSYLGPLAYTNVYVVANAINKAGSLDQAAVVKSLKETSYDSPVGDKLTFTPSKLSKNQGFTRVKILQWQKGVAQIIWPFELKTAEIAYPLAAWDKR